MGNSTATIKDKALAQGKRPSKKRNYSEWTKDELIAQVKKLEKRKKYGIVWEEKSEDVVEQCKSRLPVLKEVKAKEITAAKDSPVNLLIEGDNYHALSVLNYTHEKKIDVIYIDPPYNTGNRSWRYNNNYVERDDPFKHSKWLSFMEKRLKLARNLLKSDGVIIITIDDYEVFPLGMLMDEIFVEGNRLANITVLNKKSGRTTDKFFATCHEYYLIYARNESLAKIELFEVDEKHIAEYKYEDEISHYKWRDFLRTGGFSTPRERPNSYYPIYFNEKSGEIAIEKKNGLIEIFPIDSKGQKRVWRQTKPSLLQLVDAGDIKIEKNKHGKYIVRIKDRIKLGTKPKTVWDNPRYDAATHGTKLLESILGKAKMFDFPKSIYAVSDAIQIITRDKKNAIILDFFAGSGTTGHAVLELNKEDGGKRMFILCTNNENNICTDVCYPRVQKVIEGYKNSKGDKVEGLGGGIKYFKTDFVDAEPTDKNKKKLTNEATEMLCMKENTFEPVTDNGKYKIFKNGNHYTAIIFDQLKIPEVKKVIKQKDSHFSVYVFSLGDDTFEDDFEDLKGKVKLSPIPEAILRVYRRIFK